MIIHMRKSSLALGLSFAILLSIGCDSEDDRVSTPETNPALEHRIALYSDNGCWHESVLAADNMFEWMGYSVSLVSAADIRNDSLLGFSLLCVPGGDMYQYALDLTSSGIQKIRDFIDNGGGYIGICGGAYFAGEQVYWRNRRLSMNALGLFAGRTVGPINEIIPYPDYGMCKINFADTLHPASSGRSVEWILYYWGPVLLADTGSGAQILGMYDIVQQPAVLVCEYGQGRVFLTGAHPEIEEDSQRDSVPFGDEMDDLGSDWDMMQRAVRWCLRE